MGAGGTCVAGVCGGSRRGCAGTFQPLGIRLPVLVVGSVRIWGFPASPSHVPTPARRRCASPSSGHREPPPPGTDSGENSSQAPPFATPVSPALQRPSAGKKIMARQIARTDEAAHPRTTTSFAKTPGQPVISSFYFQACEGAVLQVCFQAAAGHTFTERPRQELSRAVCPTRIKMPPP